MSGIRTLDDIRQRCVVDDVTGCWLWSGAMANTTPSMRLPELGRTVAAGIAICFLTTGRMPRKGRVWHRVMSCRSVSCVNPEHRQEGTRTSQMAFLAGKPRSPLHRARIAATRRSSSTVTDEAVDEIRASKETGKALAARLGMSITHACRIRRQETRLPLGVSAFSQWTDAT